MPNSSSGTSTGPSSRACCVVEELEPILRVRHKCRERFNLIVSLYWRAANLALSLVQNDDRHAGALILSAAAS
jgi:hypothetical protein